LVRKANRSDTTLQAKKKALNYGTAAKCGLKKASATRLLGDQRIGREVIVLQTIIAQLLPAPFLSGVCVLPVYPDTSLIVERIDIANSLSQGIRCHRGCNLHEP
jgi:hypothetical protein